jgi:hypothetical protein
MLKVFKIHTTQKNIIQWLMILVSTLFFLLPVSAQSTAFPASIITGNPTSIDFQLVTKQNQATILIDDQDFPTVKLCAGLFRDDVERVTGYKPSLLTNQSESISNCVIIGSIERSKLIKKLISSGKIDVSKVKGQWESCLTQTIDNPMPGIGKALVIAGSDRRGTAYGIFELSKQIGVSPWYYFADVPPKKSAELSVKAGTYILKSPSVKYRGIFINDEMYGLRPWAQYTLAPEEGLGLGPTTYRKVFELLLRLKANLIWPGMQEQTRPFNYYEQNKVVAEEYGIVMGSSHIEPMLRNTIDGAEWDMEYPGEINIEYFMQMAWNISVWDHQNSGQFLTQWATREFGPDHAAAITNFMNKHYELAYARRPENMVMWNSRILNAQKSHAYGAQNRELVTVGSKWDQMASLPGPAGDQWHQWDMPTLSYSSLAGEPYMKAIAEGGDSSNLPGFSVYNQDRGFIDLYNTGNGAIYWSSDTSDDAVELDDNPPQLVSFKTGDRNVVDNLMTLHTELAIDGAGEHTLKIWMVDPGVVIDKLIINTGGLKKSYLGPPESYNHH